MGKENKGTHKMLLSVLQWVSAILFGIIIAAIVFWWEVNLGVSISSQTAVNPNDAFSTYFTFSNDSHFALTNIRCEFTMNATFNKGGSMTGVKTPIALEGELRPGHSDTERTAVAVISPNTEANMVVDIYYNPKFWFVPLPQRHDSFNFISIKTATGYYWIEKDLVK